MYDAFGTTILDILYEFRLNEGQNIYALRQKLKNKFGNEYVERQNKIMNFNHDFWKNEIFLNDLHECLYKRRFHFKLIIKNQSNNFYMAKPDLEVPYGFRSFSP